MREMGREQVAERFEGGDFGAGTLGTVYRDTNENFEAPVRRTCESSTLPDDIGPHRRASSSGETHSLWFIDRSVVSRNSRP